MVQLSLFGPGPTAPPPKPAGDGVVRLWVLITVKAAPQPSAKYGETVCVAGVNLDLQRPGWVRLYPINFRDLSSDARFRKYDIVSLDARPAQADQRRESWNPILTSISRETHLRTWHQRRGWLDPYLEDSMCALNRAVWERPDAQSLALVRPKDIDGLLITQHPGWTPEEQRKIDAYVRQPALFADHERIPLEAPRFQAAYRYRCHDPQCRGHKQGCLDWELVAFQRNFRHASDAELRHALEEKFLHQMCAPDREVAFYVGNQAKRVHVFSVLGVYWPPRR